jgi:hypothetical protein
MPAASTVPKFIRELDRSLARSARGAAGAPVNSRALLRERDRVTGSATDLLGYWKYLAKARRWKAARGGAPAAFEAEVRSQAARALASARELAAATLRTTSHLANAGELERTVSAWSAAAGSAGPVRVEALWDELTKDDGARRLFREQGVSDALFAGMDQQMRRLGGRVTARGARLDAELELSGADGTRRASLTASRADRRRGVADLVGAPVTTPRSGSEVDLASVIAAGAALTVREVARHKRKLDDTGLATYAGEGPAAVAGILIAVGIILIGVGEIGSAVYCDHEGKDYDETLCRWSRILTIIGALAILGGIMFIPGASIWANPWEDAFVVSLLGAAVGFDWLFD